MSGFDIRLVFTLAPRDSTLQTKDVYTSEMTFLALHPWIKVIKETSLVKPCKIINCGISFGGMWIVERLKNFLNIFDKLFNLF